MLIEFFSRSVHSLSANGARSAGTSGYSTGTVTVLQMMMAVLGSAFTFVSSTFTSFGPDSISPIDSDAMKCLSRLREREISFVSMRDAFIRFQTIYLPTSILFTFLNLRRGGWCRHAGRTDAAATGAGCVVMMRRWTKCAWNAFKTFQFLDEMHFQIGRSQRDATNWAARRIQWRLLPAYSNWMEIFIFILFYFLIYNSSDSIGR